MPSDTDRSQPLQLAKAPLGLMNDNERCDTVKPLKARTHAMIVCWSQAGIEQMPHVR